MKEFKFKTSRKVTVWQNEYFTIPAETKEAAIELAKKEVDEESGEYGNETETVFESIEDLPVKENDGWSTVELYDEETNEVLYENGENLSWDEPIKM